MSLITAPITHLYNALLHIYTLAFHSLLPALYFRYTFLTDLTISILSLVFGRRLTDLKPAPKNLTNKIALVTGANSGIGQQLAVALAQQHATVYLLCRNESKFQQAIDHVTGRAPQSVGRVVAMKLDTSSLDGVREFALQWSKLEDNRVDILCHNAGIATPPSGQAFTPDGVEMTYATNFLGSFLLTHLLEPYLSPSARVIFTSSTGQYSGKFSPTFSLGPVRDVCEKGFHSAGSSTIGLTNGSEGGSSRYANTKAMQVAFAKLLQRRFGKLASSREDGARRTAHSFTPGFTSTPIFGKISTDSLFLDPMFVILKLTTSLATDVDQGAATGVWLATTDDTAVIGPGKGGEYWDRLRKRLSSIDLMSEELLDRFWIRWERDAGIEWRI